MKKSIVGASFWLCVLVVVGCRTEAAPEPRPDPKPQTQTQPQGGGTMTPAAATTMTVATVPISPDDPVHGKFTLDDATKGLAPTGGLTATIDTSHGKLTCRLLADKAPITVANFVGLARGTRPWKDPRSGQWVTKPAYDGTTFHRIIKGFMIQGGDAKGDGSGRARLRHPRRSVGRRAPRSRRRCSAWRIADPTRTARSSSSPTRRAAHLDRSYTIFGECDPEPVIHMIAGVPTGAQDRPTSPVTINKITIARAASTTPPFAGAPIRDASTHD